MDPQLQRAAAMMPRTDLTDPVAAREATLAFKEFVGVPPTPDSIQIEELEIPGGSGAPAQLTRIYRPKVTLRPLPVIVYYHPGGFVLGDLDTDHARVLRLVEGAGAMVVTSMFRLAPEHPFPAGIEDAYATLCWTAENAALIGADADRIAVGGCSTGATFAAAISLLTRDRGGPQPMFQLLLYPALDDRLDTPSMTQFEDIPGGDRTGAELMWRHYLGPLYGSSEVPAYAAPARAQDLSGLPPAYLMVNEIDVCRDEELAYAMRLIAAGVPVELHHYSGTFHAFESMVRGSEISRRALDEQIAVVRRALRRRPAARAQQEPAR
ncbi:alpha/beta hydrolase [Nocardia sp. IBHARD005]|uniref:alpha/beta hydrolase n=1 Tax=Nocardia sp. IBHARD005 TaxID=3457765 RepID=UPI0040592D2B